MMFYVHQVNSNTNRSRTPASWTINKLLFSIFFRCYLHELCRSWIRIRVRILSVFVGTTVRAVLFARRRSRKLLSSSTNKVSVLCSTFISAIERFVTYVPNAYVCFFLRLFFFVALDDPSNNDLEKRDREGRKMKRGRTKPSANVNIDQHSTQFVWYDFFSFLSFSPNAYCVHVSSSMHRSLSETQQVNRAMFK